MQNAFTPSGEKAIGSFEEYFTHSRILLTAAYVLILLVILLSSGGLTRFFFSQRLNDRFERFEAMSQQNQGPPPRPPSATEVRQDFLNSVIMVNGSLLLLAGALSYWFAGKTLKPIVYAYQKQRRFLSDASHELRTPLTVLQLSLEHERDTSSSEAARALATENLEEVSRMRNLVQDLLIISQFHHQEQGDAPQQEIDLNEIVKETASRFMRTAEKHHVTIHTELDKVPITILAVNKEMVARAVANIIQNAILYNKEMGEVRVKTESNEKGARIIVEDTGIGIAKTELAQVFERFYRSDKSRSRKSGGSGLGLAIVQSIVEAAGGEVRLTSEPQKGTTVTLQFPIHKPS